MGILQSSPITAMRLSLGMGACCAGLLSACTSASPPPETAATSPPAAPHVQIANPASVYCIQQGGRLRLERTSQGEYMLCILPDGQSIDEWTYFRQQQSPSQ